MGHALVWRTIRDRLTHPVDELIRRLRLVESLAGPRFRHRWAIATALGIVSGFLEAVGALLFLAFIATVAQPRAFDGSASGGLDAMLSWLSSVEVNALVAIVAAFYVARAATLMLQNYWQYRVADEDGARLAGRVLAAYSSLPLRLQRERSSAGVMRDVNDATHSIARQLFHPLLNLLAELALILIMTLLLIIAAPVVTLSAVVVLGAIFFLVLRFVQPKLTVLGRESHAALAENLQWVRQSIEGARDIKAYSVESLFQHRFDQSRARFIGASYRSGTLSTVPRVAIETAFILFVVALVVGLSAGGDPDEFLPTLVLFAYVTLRLLPAVNRIAHALSMMKFGGAIAAELGGTLARLEPLAESRVPRASRPVPQEVSLRGVSFRYGEHLVLDEISLRIRRGEVVGILGSSGGGKSTLLDILSGLLLPDEGEVLLEGEPVVSLRQAGVPIAIVSQSPFIADDSLEANIRFGLSPREGDEQRLQQAIKASDLDAVVKQRGGLQAKVGEAGVSLSGGQRQRLALARAIYREAAITIVDEGTSALDEVTEATVIAELIEAAKTRMLVIVSHRPAVMAACDTVYELTGKSLRRL